MRSAQIWLPESPPVRPDSASRPFLSGVRVLDVTEVLSGPYASLILADLGAEVIKVERVGGDRLRRRAQGGKRSYPYEMVARGKRGLALDFTRPEGREVLLALAGTAHVFIENFRPGVLSKYGLDHNSMRDRYPSLVYCSISGFGQTGPLREAKGVDLISQGFGGLLSVTGTTDGRLAKAGYPVSDLGAGMWAAIGILGALQRRSATNEGAYIDVSLTDTIASWAVWEVADYQISGRIPAPLGTAHRLTAPYQAFLCGDGRWITVAGLAEQMPALCDLLGVPEVLADERFATEYSRFEHREALADALSTGFARHGRDEWIDLLRHAGIPCGPVLDISEIIAEEQYGSRQMFPRLGDEEEEVTVVNTPIVSDGAPRASTLGPELGADTEAVLSELGLTSAQIGQLEERGVIRCAGARSLS